MNPKPEKEAGSSRLEKEAEFLYLQGNLSKGLNIKNWDSAIIETGILQNL